MPKSKATNKPTPPDVIERIQNMRRNGIRVVDVAKACKVDIATVSKYAKGLHKETRYEN